LSKTLAASCSASVVTIDGKPVNAVILSKGLGESEGVGVLDEDKVYYITSSAEDLEVVIDKLNSALNQLVTVITAIGAGMTGPTTAPPGTLATDLAVLTTLVSELTALKGSLK
jgi:hypothetical protein